jgi:hypothetical protein
MIRTSLRSAVFLPQREVLCTEGVVLSITSEASVMAASGKPSAMLAPAALGAASRA